MCGTVRGAPNMIDLSARRFLLAPLEQRWQLRPRINVANFSVVYHLAPSDPQHTCWAARLEAPAGLRTRVRHVDHEARCVAARTAPRPLAILDRAARTSVLVGSDGAGPPPGAVRFGQ